jgi:hypothetical protein
VVISVNVQKIKAIKIFYQIMEILKKKKGNAAF